VNDHKFSVCQAIFTRPQHVARHIRFRKSPRSSSHTPPSPIPISETEYFSFHSKYRRSSIQVSTLWRSLFESFTPPAPLSLIPHHFNLAISSRDTTLVRSLSFPQLLYVAKVPHQRAEPPLQSSHATNVLSPACDTMVPIISVSLQSLSLAHSHSYI
jgi:hypothetical protein